MNIVNDVNNYLPKRIQLRHFFKSWNSIDTFLKVGTKLTHLNESEYHVTN